MSEANQKPFLRVAFLHEPWSRAYVQTAHPVAFSSPGVLVPRDCRQCGEMERIPFNIETRSHFAVSTACGLVSYEKVTTYTKLPWDGEGDPPESWYEALDTKTITENMNPAPGQPDNLQSIGQEWNRGEIVEADEGCSLESETTIEKDPPEPDWSAGIADYEQSVDYSPVENYLAPDLPDVSFRGSWDVEHLLEATYSTETLVPEGEEDPVINFRSRFAIQFRFKIDLSDYVTNWPDGLILAGEIRWQEFNTVSGPDDEEGISSDGAIQKEAFSLSAVNPLWTGAEHLLVASEPPVGGNSFVGVVVYQEGLPLW